MEFDENKTKFCKFCQTEHPLTGEFWTKDNQCRKKRAEYLKAYAEANKEKRAEYEQIYYKTNKEKLAEDRKTYREYNKEKIAEGKKIYYENNKEKFAKKSKIYREANKDKLAEYGKAYYAVNKEKLAEDYKSYYGANKDKLAEYKKVYAEVNKDKLAEYIKTYMNKCRKTDPRFKYIEKCRSRTFKVYLSRNLKKAEHSIVLLGCTPQELQLHLEKQFKPGMSHENHGLWHIDHIRPIASFLDEELDKAFHYTNLQPLWSEENLSKSDKWDES